MIDRATHCVPGMTSIEVALDEATEEMPPGIVLWTHRDNIGSDNDPTHRDWIDWMAATFQPDVCENFTLLSVYHDPTPHPPSAVSGPELSPNPSTFTPTRSSIET